jgi:hypothetical protein
MKLRGLVPNSYINVSATIGPPFLLQQNRRMDRGNI